MNEQINEALQAIEKARETVRQLCHGEIRWTMSIPAHEDSDPDLIISNALCLAKTALTALTALDGVEERKILQAAADRVALERITGDDTGNFLGDEDAAYNQGIDDAIAAILQITAPAPEQRVRKPIDIVIDVAQALRDWDGSPEQAADKLEAAVAAIEAYTEVEAAAPEQAKNQYSSYSVAMMEECIKSTEGLSRKAIIRMLHAQLQEARQFAEKGEKA